MGGVAWSGGLDSAIKVYIRYIEAVVLQYRKSEVKRLC